MPLSVKKITAEMPLYAPIGRGITPMNAPMPRCPDIMPLYARRCSPKCPYVCGRV